MRYLAKLHRGPGGVYGVAMVDLPGCFTVGDTLDETITNAAEAILCHLEGMLAAGASIPQPIVGGSWATARNADWKHAVGRAGSL